MSADRGSSGAAIYTFNGKDGTTFECDIAPTTIKNCEELHGKLDTFIHHHLQVRTPASSTAHERIALASHQARALTEMEGHLKNLIGFCYQFSQNLLAHKFEQLHDDCRLYLFVAKAEMSEQGLQESVQMRPLDNLEMDHLTDQLNNMSWN